MSTAEKLMEKKRIYKTEMEGFLSKGRSDALWRRSTERLEEILERYSSLPKSMRPHAERIFPAATVYLTLKDEIGAEKAYAVVEDAAVAGCEGIAKKLQALMRIPGMPGLFIRVWDPLVKKVFGPSNGFQNVFYPKEKGKYRMDVTACPYCRYFAELGCPELTKVFCENDERIYGDLPGVRFERTGTLGKGAERCDFLLRKE